MPKQRIQKLISGAGICSRRSSERLLIEGRVTINGTIAKLGESADLEIDEIIVNGIRLQQNISSKVILLN